MRDKQNRSVLTCNYCGDYTKWVCGGQPCCLACSRDNTTTPSLRRFMEEMDKKLQINSHKKHWRESPIKELLCSLHEEVCELHMEIKSHDPLEVQGIKAECLDVANFAMMIWDNVDRIEQLTKKR